MPSLCLSNRGLACYYALIKKNAKVGLICSFPLVSKIPTKHHFSTETSSLNSQSTERDDPGWSWKWKAFGAAVVGIGIPASIVTALKYDPETRDLLEPLFPDQVEYLRNEVGFEKEDLQRIHYVRKQEAEYTKATTAVVRFESGREQAFENIPSSRSFQEFYKSLANSGEGKIISVDFKDTADLDDSEPSFLEPEDESTSQIMALECESNAVSLWEKYSTDEKTRAKGSMNSLSTDEGLEVEDAKLLLELLDKRVKDLQLEKRTGLREIDDIDEEIKAIQARKKNINAIYFPKKWKWF